MSEDQRGPDKTTDDIPCGEPTAADYEWVMRQAFDRPTASETEYERGFMAGWRNAWTAAYFAFGNPR